MDKNTIIGFVLIAVVTVAPTAILSVFADISRTAIVGITGFPVAGAVAIRILSFVRVIAAGITVVLTEPSRLISRTVIVARPSVAVFVLAVVIETSV